MNTLKDKLSELSEQVYFVDLHDRVLRGSRRVSLRNRVIGSVAALTAIAAIAGIGAMVTSLSQGRTPMPGASETPSLTNNVTPPPSATPLQLPNVDIRNATLDLPAFPSAASCPAAIRKFVDGRAHVSPGAAAEVELVMLGEQVRANVDGAEGDEILIELGCEDYTVFGQVIAVKVSPDGKLTTLGFVMMSPDHQAFWVQPESLRVEAGTVLVDVLGRPRPDGPLGQLDLQTRGYRFEDGKFKQVSGPTKFAAPPSDYRQVDFKNTTLFVFRPPTPPRACRISGGVGTMTIQKKRYQVTVISSAFFTDDTRAAVLLKLIPQTGATLTLLHIYRMDMGVTNEPNSGVSEDLNGATMVEASGTDVKVTVNGQVRTYREDSSNGRWVRV